MLCRIEHRNPPGKVLHGVQFLLWSKTSSHREEAGPFGGKPEGLHRVSGIDGPHKGVGIDHLRHIAGWLRVQQRGCARQQVAAKAAGGRCDVGEAPPDQAHMAENLMKVAKFSRTILTS